MGRTPQCLLKIFFLPFPPQHRSHFRQRQANNWMKIVTTRAVLTALLGVTALAWPTSMAQGPPPAPPATASPSSMPPSGSSGGSMTGAPPTGSPSSGGSMMGGSGSFNGGSSDSSSSSSDGSNVNDQGGSNSPHDPFTDRPSLGSGSGSWKQPDGFDFSGSGPGWNWNQTDDSSGSGPIEFVPGIDGEAMDVKEWHKYYFDVKKGFTVAAQAVEPQEAEEEPQVVIRPGECPHRFCIYVTFESDYGAMETFDSFVMDRFEASTLMGSEQWHPNGPVPLILGRMTRQEQAWWAQNDRGHTGGATNQTSPGSPTYTNPPPRSGSYSSGSDGSDASAGSDGSGSEGVHRRRLSSQDGSAASDMQHPIYSMGPTGSTTPGSGSDSGGYNGPFLYNDPRRTVWTLYPLDNRTNQVDLVMSFKQLYTLLPAYTGPLHSNGPFYSADLTDQVVVRLTAGIPSEFSAMSAVLPIVVDHIGNQLVDLSYSSEILYPGLGFDGGNEVQLTLKLKRRRFHAFEPWFPARASPVCQACQAQLPRGFKTCFDTKVGKTHVNGTSGVKSVVEALLHYQDERTTFNAEPVGEACFEEIMHGLWRNQSDDSGSHPDDMGLEPMNATTAAQLLAQTDAGLRCMVETQCPMGGASKKNDGRVVTMHRAPARTQIHFDDPNYSFYLSVASRDELQDTHTTQVFTSDVPADLLKKLIVSAIPGVDAWNMDFEVRKFDNLAEIARIQAENARLLALYGNATSWTGSESGSGMAPPGGWTGPGPVPVGPSSDGSGGSGSGMQFPTGSPPFSGSSAGFPSPSPSSGSSSDGGSPSPSPSSPPSSSPPPPPGRRRRLMSSDGSADAGFPEPTTMGGPKPPRLHVVPTPRFSIELVSHNVTMGIQVIDVLTSFPVQWTSQVQTLSFDVTPLNVETFRYNPPPPGLNLEWRDPSHDPVRDPSDSTQQFPSMPLNDSCSECMDAYHLCLFDVDCAYGVRTFLWGAMQPVLFENPHNGTNETRTIRTQATPQSPVFLEVHLTELLQQARAYFTPGGYDKLSRYLTCLAKTRPVTNSCNVDGQHRVLDPRNGSWVYQNGFTTLRLIPARVELTLNKGSTLFMNVDGMDYQWNEDGVADHLKNVLLSSVFPQVHEESFAFDLDVVRLAGEASGSNKVTYQLLLHDFMGKTPRFWTADPDYSVTTWPWELVLEAMDDNLVQEPHDVVHWSRLMEWLYVFTWYDLSGGGSGGSTVPGSGAFNGTTTSGNPDGNPTWTPPPPSALNVVCTECSGKLATCLMDYNCTNALRSRFPMDLNPDVLATELGTDQLYRTQWSSVYQQWATSMDPTTFHQVDALIECLAALRCPVGYGTAPSNATAFTNETAPKYPTFIHHSVVAQFTRPWGAAPFSITYRDMTRYMTVSNDVFQFCNDVQAQYLTMLHCTAHTASDGSPHDVIVIVGSAVDVGTLQVALQPETPPTTVVWFESHFPVLPTWNYLAEWFPTTTNSTATNSTTTTNSSMTANTTTDPCFHCQDKIQACIANGDCWTSVQQFVLPILRQERGPFPLFAFFDGNQYVIRQDVTAVIRAQSEMHMHTVFSMPEAWNKFIDVVACFQHVQCDVSHMEGASAAPATAHSPTTIALQENTVQLLLYVDTELQVVWDNATLTYTEQGQGTSENLRLFLNSAIGGRIPFEIVGLTRQPEINRYDYTVRLTHSYTDNLPLFQIAMPGQVNGNESPRSVLQAWNLYFQSAVATPIWDKLIDLLSISGPSASTTTNGSGSNTTTPFVCSACTSQWTACWNDYMCQYMVMNSANPLFQSMDSYVAFNSSANLFQADLTSPLLMNVLPMASTAEAKARFFDVLQCSAQSACVHEAGQVAAPFETVALRVTPAQSRIEVPIDVMINIYYQGSSWSFAGDVYGLKLTLESQVLNPSISVEIQRTVNADQTMATYVIIYHGLYDMSLPHFEWPGAGPTPGSQDTPIQVVFVATTPHMKDAFAPWLSWLQRSPIA